LRAPNDPIARRARAGPTVPIARTVLTDRISLTDRIFPIVPALTANFHKVT
jgi:hypothetical protein